MSTDSLEIPHAIEYGTGMPLYWCNQCMHAHQTIVEDCDAFVKLLCDDCGASNYLTKRTKRKKYD
jgi:hypothetical protein